jgi:hypothetical protein
VWARCGVAGGRIPLDGGRWHAHRRRNEAFCEACKGFALALALWHWGVGSGVGGHVARSLGHVQWSMRHSHTRTISTNWEKKRSGTMAKPPSYRWSNEGILLGFQTVGISRRLEVHDRSSCTSNI